MRFIFLLNVYCEWYWNLFSKIPITTEARDSRCEFQPLLFSPLR